MGTEAVTEEKVVIKEAKVAITNKTLATLSAKLSVNNKFQQMYSLCGCVYIYDIYFWICYALVSLSEKQKKRKKAKRRKRRKKENHTLSYKNTNSIPGSFTIIYSNYKQVPIIHTFSTSLEFFHSFHPLSSCLIIS